jgi:beta-galactosidase
MNELSGTSKNIYVMKTRKTVPTFIAVMLSFLATAQAPSSFFEPSKMIETGIYYYPEAWPEAQWDRDFAKMAEMGFEFTHMSEFAWARLEPTEGNYDFTWLDKAVALAAKHGLKVIMCTPTACPPAWLSTKYPEIFLVKDDGIRAQHGSREHYSWSSSKYRELSAKIVTEMAKHFGNDSRIWGWQIGNEPSHYGVIDYNPEAISRFREWLKNKYGTIENLNLAWGASFWSLSYNDFSQIVAPSDKRQSSGISSHHSSLDFKRFCADECAGFLSEQVRVLKSNISNKQFVTSNFMHNHFDVDARRSSDLDFPCYTVYPVAGYSKGIGSQGFRLGDPWRVSFSNDYFRPQKGTTGVMELQPGQVNWGSTNPQIYPGLVRAWLWNAFAGDLSFACSYRFRQPLYGSEQYHAGIVGTDGVTPSSGGLEYSKFMQEIRDLRKQYNVDSKNPKEYDARRTAILFNIDNLWETNIQKLTKQWDFDRNMCNIYNAVKSLGAPVDFIDEEFDFEKYKVIIAPAYQLIDKALVEKWKKYVENGGNLVLTSRTGQKDRNGHLFEMPWAGNISQLIGGKVSFYDMLPEGNIATIKSKGIEYKWSVWADVLENDPKTEVLATYTDQFYAGKAAVISHKLGKGTVTYIGPVTNDASLEKSILQQVYSKAGLTTVALPEGIMMEYRNGFGIAINYNSITQEFPLPSSAKIIVGTTTMVPAGVLVWKEQLEKK